MALPARKAIWDSPRGYSAPDEVVDVVDQDGDLMMIVSHADADEDGDGFSYWVHEDELTFVVEAA